MTTTVFLVRHAVHDLIGRVLTGRMPGVSLGPAGLTECGRLAERFAREEVAAIYSSPLERTRETAEAIAHRLNIDVELCDGLTEINYGEWTGLSFKALRADPRWSEWNRSKASGCPPGGETLRMVQERAVAAVESIVRALPDCAAVLVSHGDVIKSIVAHYLGIALDGIARFEISPASVSTVAIDSWGAKVHALNEVAPS